MGVRTIIVFGDIIGGLYFHRIMSKPTENVEPLVATTTFILHAAGKTSFATLAVAVNAG